MQRSSNKLNTKHLFASLRNLLLTVLAKACGCVFDPKAGLPHVLVSPGCGFLLILQTSLTHFHLKLLPHDTFSSCKTSSTNFRFLKASPTNQKSKSVNKDLRGIC